MQRLFLCLSLLTIAACQQASHKSATVAATTQQAFTLPDSSQRQLAAPDTLFEDGSRPTGWDVAGFDHPEDFKKFLALFKDWVQNDAVDSIIAHVKFPLAHYKTAAELKAHYPQVFDSTLKVVVLQQRLDRVFRNYQGAMLGNGVIWWAQLDGQYKIIAINK